MDFRTRDSRISGAGGSRSSTTSRTELTTTPLAAPTTPGPPTPAASPNSGFFYDDGGDGDIRGRTENFFTATARAAKPPAPKPKNTNGPEPEMAARKMIYSASYSVMVPVVDDAIKVLTARVSALGGYLSQRNNSTLTVRIPAAKFASFVIEIPALGRVVSESMNANDVTNQHVDLTIRLENAEKSRQRLLVLIEKATKMEDIIKIEEALRRITGEIERMKGQLKLMNDQIAFSTVSVTLQANAPQAKATKKRQQSPFPWINRIGIEQDLRRF